jgi:hypothetical protein
MNRYEFRSPDQPCEVSPIIIIFREYDYLIYDPYKRGYETIKVSEEDIDLYDEDDY